MLLGYSYIYIIQGSDLVCQKAVLSVHCHVSNCVPWGDMGLPCRDMLFALAVVQMNCLRRICGISLLDHIPSEDMLNSRVQDSLCKVSAAKQTMYFSLSMQWFCECVFVTYLHCLIHVVHLSYHKLVLWKLRARSKKQCAWRT